MDFGEDLFCFFGSCNIFENAKQYEKQNSDKRKPIDNLYQTKVYPLSLALETASLEQIDTAVLNQAHTTKM